MSLASKVNIPVHTPGLHGAAKLVLITGCAQEEPQVEREGEETNNVTALRQDMVTSLKNCPTHLEDKVGGSSDDD